MHCILLGKCLRLKTGYEKRGVGGGSAGHVMPAVLFNTAFY
jgi:hypothetical protein